MSRKANKNKSLKHYQTSISALSHDGRGISVINHKKAFITGGLPGESILCQTLRERTHFIEATTIQVEQASLQRVAPPCEHFTLCGGCSLQHMNMELQLQLKEKSLLEQLQHFGKVVPHEVLPPLHVNSQGYRRKARLGVKYVTKKNKIIVGFREKASRYLADLTQCHVLHDSVGKKFPLLNKLITSLNIYEHIPQIEIAVGHDQSALVFRHLKDFSLDDKEKLILFGQQHHFQIYLQPNSPATIEKLWPADNQYRLRYLLPDYQLEFLFHPLDFTQVNHEMNQLMVKQALNLLELNNTDTVLDLFCGIGNFSLPMAQYACSVTGVEGSKEMVTRAQENAVHNHITNAEFYVENLEQPTPNASWIKTKYSKILLDPPRTGAKEIMPFLANFDASRIVYVSCNPATLARDAGLLAAYGYQLSKVGIINMFAHTSHVEAMAQFDKITAR